MRHETPDQICRTTHIKHIKPQPLTPSSDTHLLETGMHCASSTSVEPDEGSGLWVGAEDVHYHRCCDNTSSMRISPREDLGASHTMHHTR